MPNTKSILEKHKRGKLIESTPAIKELAQIMLTDAVDSSISELEQKMERMLLKFKKDSKDIEDKLVRKIDKLQTNFDLSKKGDRGVMGIQGEKGRNGLNGVDGRKGKDGKKGRDGFNGREGIDGVDGSPDKPNEIANKLNTLTEQIDTKVIKGFDKIISNLRQRIQETKSRNLGGGVGGGGMGNFVHQQFDGDGSTTQFTLSSNVANGGNAIVGLRYEGQMQYLGDQFTISGNILTMTFTPENNTKIEITYIRA